MRKGPRAVRANRQQLYLFFFHLYPSVSSASVFTSGPSAQQSVEIVYQSPPLYQALSPSFFTISSPLYQALSISPQAKVISSLPFIICLVVPENEFQKRLQSH